MELKRLVTKYVYRIEPKPDGGFIAHATDPSVPPLEAPTRAELQQKIQSTVFAGLASDFPGLKLPQSTETQFSFHVERNSNGGFDIHASNSDDAPLQAATHDEVESKFAEKLVGFVGKHWGSEIAQALAAQGISGDVNDIKVFVKKTGFRVATGEAQSAAVAGAITDPGGNQPASASTIDGAIIKNSIFASGPSPISSSPVTPETSSSGRFFRFLLAALIIAGIIYLLVLRSR